MNENASEEIRVKSMEDSLEKLRDKLDAILGIESSEDRLQALELFVAHCAQPLRSTEALSAEYDAFLMALGRLHMLESARVRLRTLVV